MKKNTKNMKNTIGRMMILVSLLVAAFAVFQGHMMDINMTRYVFLNRDQLALLVGLSIALFFVPLKTDMLRR